MTLEINNDYGNIDISNDVIATVVGSKVVECYGIVGMASKQQVRDGIAEILGRENYAKGIVIHSTNDSINVDMYVIVSYGVKISETARHIQQAIFNSLTTMTTIEPSQINVHITNIEPEN